jgi:outer membrane protein TolC
MPGVLLRRCYLPRLRSVAGVALLLVPIAASAESPTLEITLAEAIRLAADADPAAVAAAAAVSSARADLREAWGAWLPTLEMSSRYSNSSDERVDQSTGRIVSESYNAQIFCNLEVFSGGGRIASNRAAQAGVAASEAEYRAQLFRTILRTTEVFYETAAAADLERLAEQRLERAGRQLEFAQTRFDLGTATSSDLLRASLEVGNAELAALDAKTSLRTASLELGRQIGMAGQVHPVPAALPERAPDLPPRESLIERAVRSSPSVAASEAILNGRRASRLAAKASYFPSAQLSGGYDWFAYDFPPDQQSWSLRVIASLPIFDGFRREGTLQKAKAEEEIAEARVRDSKIAVRVEVETAIGEIESAARRVEISDRAKELAVEDLRVLEERYQIGAATILDLQTSQLLLTEAEAATVRARQALGTAIARLEAVLGERIEEGTRDYRQP